MKTPPHGDPAHRTGSSDLWHAMIALAVPNLVNAIQGGGSQHGWPLPGFRRLPCTAPGLGAIQIPVRIRPFLGFDVLWTMFLD